MTHRVHPSRLIMLVATLTIVGLVTMVASAPPATALTRYDWLQFDGNAQHSGVNALETQITAGNVGTLHKLYRVPLVSSTSPSVADGAPAYLSNVSTPSGTRDLLFITTEDGHILPLDAATGHQIWSHQYGPNGCLINHNTQRNEPCYTTSSPAIDPSRRDVYSYGLGTNDSAVHKYAVGTGQEVTTGGWPELTSIKDWNEKGSSDITIATVGSASYLYMPNGGYPGDMGDYQGHVTTINLSTGSQHVFNTLCSNKVDVHLGIGGCTNSSGTAITQAAVWARAGVVYDSATGKVYFATGNGNFNPSAYQWGDSVLVLHPNGTGQSGSNTGKPLDSYTPTNQAFLQSNDLDLGSTAPALLPTITVNGQVKHLAVQGGKGPATTNTSDPVTLRLINLENLSGQGGPGHLGGDISDTPVPQGGEVLTTPVVWRSNGTTWVFVGNDKGISGLKLVLGTSGTPTLKAVWVRTGTPATSPLLANGVLYVAGSNDIRALDPATGRQLWSSTAIGGIHWQSPVVDNGRLFIEDNAGYLTAFGL